MKMKNISKLLLLIAFGLSACALPVKRDPMDSLIEKMDRLKLTPYQEFMKKVKTLEPMDEYIDDGDNFVRKYDINSDGKVDFVLGYYYFKVKDPEGYLKLELEKYPVFYYFDFNQDGVFSNDEKIIDLKRDGINDNEITGEEAELKMEQEKDEKNQEPNYPKNYSEQDLEI